MRRFLLYGAILFAGAQAAHAETLAPSSVTTSLTNEVLPAKPARTLACEVYLSNPKKLDADGQANKLRYFGRRTNDPQLPDPFEATGVGTAIMVTALPRLCGPMLQKCAEERAKLPAEVTGVTAEKPKGDLSCTIGRVLYAGCTYDIEYSKPINPGITTTKEDRCNEQVAVSGLLFYRKMQAESFSTGVLNCYQNPAKCAEGLQPRAPAAAVAAESTALLPPASAGEGAP